MYKFNSFDNLQSVLDLYYQDIRQQHSDKKAKEIISQTETAINKYCLPYFGFSGYQKRKATQEDIKAAVAFRQQLNIKEIPQLEVAFDDTVTKLNCSNNIRYVYSSRQRDFRSWFEQQSSTNNYHEKSLKKDRCPTNRYLGYGSQSNLTLIKRSRKDNYGMKDEDISQSLEVQLKEFKRFRTASNYPYRLQDAVKVDVCDNQIKHLKLILGWHHNYRNIPQDSLSLETLVPLVGTKIPGYPWTIETLEDVSDYVDNWLCEFMDFLVIDRECQSPHTLNTMVVCVNNVAKFHFLKLGAKDDYRNIPVINLIRRRLQGIAKDISKHQSVIDLELKWLDLPDVITHIVEPLRVECQRRYASGTLRTLNAIIDSIMRYCLWGCFTYLPPRRQQEWRKAKISLSCPIQKPDKLPPSGFIHPLPPPGVRHLERFFPYIYYSEEGKWLLDLPPESYKTGKTHGYQVIEIPNRIFEDGRCFYEYLEMWLYGFFCQPDGTLAGAGFQLDFNSEKMPRIFTGRLIYDCDHEYFFSQHNGKPVSSSSLENYLSRAAYGKTGKRLNPHLLRDIYATYFLDLEYSDAVISALAYSMGHTVKELRKSYDARRSGDKRRPIETALTDVLNQIHGTSSSVSNSSELALQKILELLPQLSPGERAKLKQIL